MRGQQNNKGGEFKIDPIQRAPTQILETTVTALLAGGSRRCCGRKGVAHFTATAHRAGLVSGSRTGRGHEPAAFKFACGVQLYVEP